MDIKDLARLVDVDPVALQEKLEQVKVKYEKDKTEVPKYLFGKESEDLMDNISSHSSMLARKLREMPASRRVTLSLVMEQTPDYLEDLLTQLEALSKLTRGKHYERDGRRRQHHRDFLLNGLAEVYTALTGRSADTTKRFQSFVANSCDYLELDDTGLWERHRKQYAKRKKL